MATPFHRSVDHERSRGVPRDPGELGQGCGGSTIAGSWRAAVTMRRAGIHTPRLRDRLAVISDPSPVADERDAHAELPDGVEIPLVEPTRTAISALHNHHPDRDRAQPLDVFVVHASAFRFVPGTGVVRATLSDVGWEQIIGA